MEFPDAILLTPSDESSDMKKAFIFGIVAVFAALALLSYFGNAPKLQAGQGRTQTIVGNWKYYASNDRYTYGWFNFTEGGAVSVSGLSLVSGGAEVKKSYMYSVVNSSQFLLWPSGVYETDKIMVFTYRFVDDRTLMIRSNAADSAVFILFGGTS
jgi:hypothetical protein